MQGPYGPGSLRLLPVGNERRVKETAIDVVNGENDQGGCCKYIVHIDNIWKQMKGQKERVFNFIFQL